MSTYLIIILAYLFALTVLNFVRSRKIKSQEQFMVAGRSLKWQVMVFTLICTWIGSGTFISGAEFASKAGFSALVWSGLGKISLFILLAPLGGMVLGFGFMVAVLAVVAVDRSLRFDRQIIAILSGNTEFYLISNIKGKIAIRFFLVDSMSQTIMRDTP